MAPLWHPYGTPMALLGFTALRNDIALNIGISLKYFVQSCFKLSGSGSSHPNLGSDTHNFLIIILALTTKSEISHYGWYILLTCLILLARIWRILSCNISCEPKNELRLPSEKSNWMSNWMSKCPNIYSMLFLKPFQYYSYLYTFRLHSHRQDSQDYF